MKKTFLIFLLLGAALLSAQKKDLKVGLVLSGGGARGYAHIGALQVLEEAGIRVDYIGGTSMGSIVGGLYASGYTAFQLEQMLRATDIMAELQDAIGRDNRTIYEKLYNEHYLIDLHLEGFALQLPVGLSNGQRIHHLLSHWTTSVHNVTDFSKLPTPFLCVGTDVETGEAIVLENGKLVDAMRVSAALPGVLSPYKMNGYTMTDGGLSNNYPAEEVKNKGMDYMIGITVEQDPYAANEIKSLPDLLLQIAFFQGTRRNIEQYAITDIDIKPDLGEYSQLSFEAIDDLISAGRLAAEAQLETLSAIAQQQQSRPPVDTVRVQENLNATIVEVRGNKDLSRRQVLSFFEGKLPGSIGWTDFREGLMALSGTGRYANVLFDLEAIPDKEDEVKLVINLEQSPGFGQQLRLGLHYDQEYRANILVGLTLNDLIIDNTETTIDLIGGSRFRYRADFRVNRVNGSAFGLRSRLHYANIGFDLPEVIGTPGGLLIERLDFRFNDLNAELYWDFRQTENSFTGIAAEFKYYQNTSEQLAAADSSSLFRLGEDYYFVPNAYFLYDKLDDRQFPMSGFSINAKARAITNIGEPLEEGSRWAVNGDFQTLLLFPLSKKMSMGTELNVGGFLDNSSLPYRYYLGSNNRNLMNNFKLFPSLELGGASGDNLLMGELFTRFNPSGKHYFTLGCRTARLGNAEGLPSSVKKDWLVAGRLTYGLSSLLGPIELTYAHGNTGKELYLNLGYWF